MTKAPTVKLQGKDYATVPARLKIFREENPNGDIVTEPQIQEDGSVMFKAVIVKDKKVEGSASATGHALGGTKGAKDFEKLETIAVGRALALLGYAASGEIASSEEMEEFQRYRQEQVQAAIDLLNACETLDELKKTFLGLGNFMSEKSVIAAKDSKKAELS